MSFDVSSGGTAWSNFKLKTNFSVGGCSGTIEITVFGPGAITNDQFSYSGSTYSFSGQFTSPTTASGTYAFVNHSIPNCGLFSQSGTWTASSTGQPPDPPSNLTALALSQTQILLEWQDNSIDETGFKIEQALTATGPWTQIATTPANVTSHAPPGLNCGTTYYYRVRAYNAYGNSAYSNTANATTLGCPPEPPSNPTALAVSQTQILLAWQDNSNNETGFKIEQSLTGTSGWTQIATTLANVISHTVSGLNCGTTYYYQVRAYNASGDSAYSDTANATTLACTTVFLPVVMKDWPPIVSHTYTASTDDTTLLTNNADTWYGNYIDLAVGYSTAQQINVGIARAIMRFDLTSIPAGTDIKSASLQPYLTGAVWSTGQSNLMAVTAYRINQPWPGSPVWNNFADAYAEGYGSATIGITFGRSNIDVTELVRGWVNGVWPNYGIMLRGQEGGYINLKVFGSANGSPIYRPQLVVEYPDPMAAGSTVTVVIPAEPVEGTDSRSMFESWIPSAGEGVEYERTK